MPNSGATRMFSYKTTPKKQPTSKKRSFACDSDEDDLTTFVSKKTFNLTGDLINQMEFMHLSKPSTLKESSSCDTLFDHSDAFESQGNSDYENSDHETNVSKPIDILNTSKVIKKHSTIQPVLVNNSLQAFKSRSFISFGYKFNALKKKWTRKGPMTASIQATNNGDAKLCAHYLYGMNSVSFNFRCTATVLN